ncbi:hypothetical protein B0H14DRAFT_2823733 [Mycena olivaceomarginata]|nr:hypothetical protein B0H14DRAFT_2823733 [Mycena olivaceomarginata]
MREFGARALLPFLASRPGSGVAAGSRPMSGVSGPSGTSSDGTTGSGKSGGTVYTDARETLSTRGSRPSSRVRGWEGAEAPPPTPPLPTPLSQSHDPLDAPAPPALAAFAGSQTSLHRQQSREEEEDEELLHHSRDNSMSGTSHQQTATLAGSASNTTLATDTPLKPERAEQPRQLHAGREGQGGEHRQLGQGGAGARIQPARVAFATRDVWERECGAGTDTGWRGTRCEAAVRRI